MNKFTIHIHKDFIEYEENNCNIFKAIKDYLGNYRIEGEDPFQKDIVIVSFLADEELLEGHSNQCDVNIVRTEYGEKDYIMNVTSCYNDKIFKRFNT